MSSTTLRTTPASGLLIVHKDAEQSAQSLQSLQVPGLGGKSAPAASPAPVRSGMVAVMVLGLAVLTLALAVGGRKAMESFDRRHYTRLELNDLHYEV